MATSLASSPSWRVVAASSPSMAPNTLTDDAPVLADPVLADSVLADPVLADSEAGEQQRQLARNRDTGALGNHQQEDAEGAEAGDQGGHRGRTHGRRLRHFAQDRHQAAVIGEAAEEEVRPDGRRSGRPGADLSTTSNEFVTKSCHRCHENS